MRFLPNIRFGTERYPEKVARRLRAMNIAAWIAAAQAGFFAILRMLDPAPGMFTRGLTNAGMAAAFAALPLLHRFSPLAGPLVFIAFAYAMIFRSAYQTGSGSGGHMYFLTATALIALLIGTEHVVLAALAAAIAAGLIILLHLVAPYNTGLVSPELQFWGSFVTSAVVNTVLLFTVMFYAFRQVARAEAAAEREHQRSESLLQNILPTPIAERLKSNPGSIADSFAEATILFVDIVGFTKLAETMSPEALVGLLNGVFSEIDDLTEKYGLEKIKTIGDAYMVVAGAPERRTDHAEAMALMSLELRDGFAKLARSQGHSLDFRIGIHSGPVVAGVIGKKKFSYDMWGDTVNTAARMESHGIPGEIQVSAQFQDLLKDKFIFIERGVIDMKGKGELLTYLLKEHRVQEHTEESIERSSAPR